MSGDHDPTVKRALKARFWTDKDGEGFEALADEMIGFVRGWTVGGMILFFWTCVALAMAGILDAVWTAMCVLWTNIPVLAAGIWIWRQQFVPLRVGPQPLVGASARRFARKLVATAMAVDAAVLLELMYRADGIAYLRRLFGPAW